MLRDYHCLVPNKDTAMLARANDDNDLANKNACESLFKELSHSSDLSGKTGKTVMLTHTTIVGTMTSPDCSVSTIADCKGTPKQHGRQDSIDVTRSNALLITSDGGIENGLVMSSSKGIANIVEMPDLEGSILYDDVLMLASITAEPRTYKEALRSEDRLEWLSAIATEHDNLAKRGV